jgi:hypothetical protein
LFFVAIPRLSIVSFSLQGGFFVADGGIDGAIGGFLACLLWFSSEGSLIGRFGTRKNFRVALMEAPLKGGPPWKRRQNDTKKRQKRHVMHQYDRRLVGALHWTAT